MVPSSCRRPLNADQQALVSGHLNLAQMMARMMTRHYPRWRDDWESAAYLGLIQAAQMFDQMAGARFDTFARFRIRGAMLDAKRGLGPVGWKRIRLQGPTPRTEPLDCDVMDRDVRSVGFGLEELDDLDDLIRYLHPRERVVMRLLYGEGLTQGAVGRRLGCASSLVSRRHADALATLRTHFNSPR